MEHALVFAAFYLSGLIVHKVAHKFESHKAADGHKFAVFAAAFAHPVFLDAVREFVLHIVVYSGKVIVSH